MKTAEEQLKHNWGFSEEDFKKLSEILKKDNLINLNDIVTEMQFYAREAIKEDREHVARLAKTKTQTYGHPDPFEWSSIVDKDSIINAPQIILK